MLTMLLWLATTSYDPVQMFVYSLAGCKSDCAAEQQAFVDSRAVYLAIDDRHLLLKPNGAIEVVNPTPEFGERRVVATLPRRETLALFKEVELLRDQIASPHKQWLDKPLSLESQMVTIALAAGGKLHFVQKSAMDLSHDYRALLVALIPYLDAEALRNRAKGEEHVVTAQEPIDRTKTNLRGYRVLHETPEHLTLQLDLEYDGSHGEQALTCASAFDNAREQHTGCRPNVVRKGRSVTCVIVSTKNSPQSFESTTLEIPLYERGGETFFTVRLPMWKTWKRAAGTVECAKCNAVCLK